MLAPSIVPLQILCTTSCHWYVQIRKDLAKGNYREKHWHWGSLLLGLGVAMGVAGPINTYLRTGAKSASRV